MNFDEYFIIPFNKDMQKSMLVITAKSTSYFLSLNEKYDVDKIKLNIQVKSEELGLDTESYLFNESLEDYKKEHIDIYKSISITTSIVTVMSIFTITATILASIQKRKREIGIRIVTGASISYIRKLFLGSTLLNIIGCMDQVTEGQYYLNGKLINELNNKELSKVRN